MSKPVYATLTIRVRGGDPGDENALAIDDQISEAFDEAEEAAKRLCPDGYEVEVDAG